MEPYIIFNGIDSRSMGVIVEKMPDIHRPARNVESIAVPGRDGRLLIDDKTYDFYSITVKINCFGTSLENVYQWLDGAGWLVIGDNPDRAAWASADYAVKNTRFRCAGCYDSLTVTFYCQPYWYAWPMTERHVITAFPHTLINPSGCGSCPEIIVEGTGDVVVLINTQLMEFEGLEDGIIVDAEMQDCFTLEKNGLLNSVASMDDFPRLAPGANIIDVAGDGTVSKITVVPRWRYL